MPFILFSNGSVGGFAGYRTVAGYKLNYETFISNIRDLYERKDDSFSLYIKVLDHAV